MVWARDTDVLALLTAHIPHIGCTVWMMAGTSKKPKFIPVNDVFENLPPGAAQSLLAFHAITGCDTTSFLSGHTKKTSFKTFKEHFNLLGTIGEGDFNDEKCKAAEQFVCRIYNQAVNTTDEARYAMFAKVNSPDLLPPTSDAVKYHLQRCHYQTMVWKSACVPNLQLPEPEEIGWKIEQDELVPILMTKQPIPESCIAMIKCTTCKTGCRSKRCACRKGGLPCTGLCGCNKYNKTVTCINRI